VVNVQPVVETLASEMPDQAIAEAILRTLLYADVFSFPMTDSEIHHYLIDKPSTLDEIRTTLHRSAWLTARIEQVNGYYTVAGRSQTADIRHQRDAASRELWPIALHYGRILAHLPFVRMVALTGALAVKNASASRDDIDYLLITSSGRVWIARALAVIVVRMARLQGIGLCPNYVLAETALEQDRKDLFTAHELAQMVPIAGLPLYEAMRMTNAWSHTYLPNAAAPYYREVDQTPRGIGHLLQWVGELVLGGPVGNMLERWEQRRKLRKFEAQLRQSGSAAQLDEVRVKGHFNDYGYPALRDYEQRLRDHDLWV
jgi:hypothetical protein